MKARAFKIIGGALLLLWSLGPVYWALNVSLMTRASLQTIPPPMFPSPPTFDNYAQLLMGGSGDSASFYAALRNSLVEALGASIFTIAVSVLAGYAFARMRFRGSKVLFVGIMAMMSVPLIAVLLPLFQFTANVGLMDTYWPIILLNVTMVMPVTIWIMRGFVATLPPDIEAAARLDGASEQGVFFQIVLPLLRPAIASVAIITFLTSWSQFMAPLLFSHSDASQPVAVLLPSFVGRNAANLGLQAAGGILALLLPLVLTVLLHRSLLGGLLGGAVK